MRLARGALRIVTDRAPGGGDRRARRLARERAEESTPLVAPTPCVDEETARVLDADDAPTTSTARAVRAGWTCVALTALTALAGATWATTVGTRGWLVSTSSTVAPGRFFIRDGRAREDDDANFCAATTSGIACASACDAARAPDVFEVREAEDGVGGYVTVWRRRANGEATRCATGSEDGGKAVIVCDDDGRETARETARARFIIASADGGRRRRRYSTSMYNQEFGGYCRDDAEDHVATCAFSKWSTSNARYAFVPVDDPSVAACAPLREGESTRARRLRSVF